MTVEDFAFKPNAIALKQGEKAVIRLASLNSEHGIGIPGLGISQTIDIDIPTDKAGTFDFFCNVPSGSGHKQMTGTTTIS